MLISLKESEMLKLIKKVKGRANEWLSDNYDDETKNQVKDLIYNKEKEEELIDSFYKDLEFGTGGLRGVMGVGTNRMNKYTVRMATQGLSNYLIKVFANEIQIKVSIAYDSRNHSKDFADVTADVLSANGFKVYLFNDIRPLPELSFVIRYLKCQCGIIITASHNPKEYNGYKVFWDDGGQIISPHDKKIIEEVKNINIDKVKFTGDKQNIIIIGEEIDKEYLKQIKSLSLSQDSIEKYRDLKIVYSPLHGTGVRLVPQILKEYGFTNIYHVPEQDKIDGNFPTLKSPNPEDDKTLEMAIKRAKEVNADLVMVTDPDADRMRIGVKDHKNIFVLLNGNQAASLITYYLITKWKEKGKLKGNEYIVKTIVTSELLQAIAVINGVECYDVLTGFKWIANIIRQNEGKKTFICGGEESIGFLIGDFVRDKDAVSCCAMAAEVAAWAANLNKTLYELLIDIYLEFGFYKEYLYSVIRKGISGEKEIQDMMESYRIKPMPSINNSDVIIIKDYLLQKEKDLRKGTEQPINLPKSNVIQFYLEDDSKITIRPSGTEPKIKFYFEVKHELKTASQFEKIDTLLNQKIDNIISSMGLF